MEKIQELYSRIYQLNSEKGKKDIWEENRDEIDTRCVKLYNAKIKVSQVTWKNKASSEGQNGHLINPHTTN